MATATKDYPTPPETNYERTTIAVGVLNAAADTKPGPQRDTQWTSPRWRTALRARSKRYGDFNPLFVTDRIGWRMDDGTIYPLDGNGSNHWYENLFGPLYQVPIRIITNAMTVADAARIFEAIQAQRKPVTRAQTHWVEATFNVNSVAHKTEALLEEYGFKTSASVNDPWGVPSTAVDFVWKLGSEERLRWVLGTTSENFPDDDPKRTNASLFKGLGVLAGHQSEFDMALMLAVLRRAGSAYLSAGARGRASEDEVFKRMQSVYANAVEEGVTLAQLEALEATESAEEAAEKLRIEAENSRQALVNRDLTIREIPAADPEAAARAAAQDQEAEAPQVPAAPQAAAEPIPTARQRAARSRSGTGTSSRRGNRTPAGSSTN
jgi:hypothetical protein